MQVDTANVYAAADRVDLACQDLEEVFDALFGFGGVLERRQGEFPSEVEARFRRALASLDHEGDEIAFIAGSLQREEE